MKYDSPEELMYWCAINKIFGFAPKSAFALIKHFGGADKIFSIDRKELAAAIGADSGYLEQITMKSAEDAYSELCRLEKDGIRFICIDDERYPTLLKECFDPPAGLYVKSDSSLEEVFGHKIPLAMVGTRDLTAYGKEWCIRIVNSLASTEAKPVIISGLAIGTDITAHIAALDSGLPTIAVLPTGPDDIYPFRHGWHAERISHSPGSALITDYPPGTVPKAINFLRRNRIIAGMSLATVLIESKIKGGGMMTCRLASSYGRDIYALPGRIDDICSAGCNELIRSKIAEALTSVGALAADLGLDAGGKHRKISIRRRVQLYFKDSEEENIAIKLSEIADIIAHNREIRPEDIASLTNLEFKEVSRYVSILECERIITTDLLRQCSINPMFLLDDGKQKNIK